MKQSKKLLSLVLAMLMAFSVVTVGVNAALVKNQVQYNSIDQAVLTAEQVAEIALDAVDEILPNDEVDLSVLGTLHLDTLNQLIPDVYDVLDSFVASIAGGDVSNLRENRSLLKGWSRTGNNIGAFEKLLQYFAASDTVKVIKKAPYGLLTDDGIRVGSLINGIIAGLVDLDDINGILTNLGGYVAGMAYDALMYGSYGYDKDYEELGNKLPAEVDTVDELLNVAIINLLTNPQDYSYEGSTKVWDMNSKLVNDADLTAYFGGKSGLASKVNVNNNSLLQILDNILQYAYEEYGVVGINNSLKKEIMKGMGIDMNEIDASEVPAAIMAKFNDEASYTNYVYDDCIANDDTHPNKWYYTNVRSRIVDVNDDGLCDENDVDQDGNVVKEKKHIYYVADLADGNAFVNLVNWDYEFTAADANFPELIATYGSIFGSLNHLLYVIFNKGINPAALGVDSVDALWADGNNSMLNSNLMNVIRAVLNNYSPTIFGKGNAYVSEAGVVDPAFLAIVNDASTDLVDLVAYIGLPLFEEEMPELIMPKNADGSYAFDDGVQIYEFGVLVIREFISEIAPAVNYDSAIFKSGTLTSATGRKFAAHSADEWFNILLNMGLDVAYTFLNGYTNFATDIPAVGTSEARWKDMLNTIVTWAVNYIGNAGASVLAGFEPNTVLSIDGGFNKLSYAFNKLLPLGFISNCASQDYAFDINVFIDTVLKPVIKDLDVSALIGLFGRTNGTNKNGVYNPLSDANVVTMVLKLADQILGLVFGSGLLPTTANCNTLLSDANIGTLAGNIFTKLYARCDAILRCGLPVAGQLVEDWGGEQELGTPKISLEKTIVTSSGALSGASFTVANGSKGVWRHYIDKDGYEHQDNQYTYRITGVKAYDITGAISANVTVKSFTTTNIDFGQQGTVTYDVKSVPTNGAVVRFEITYNVYNEDGEAMANGKAFTVNSFVYFSYAPSNERITTRDKWEGTGDNYSQYTYTTDWYIPASNAAGFFGDGLEYATYEKSSTGWTKREYGVTCAEQAKYGIKLDAGAQSKTTSAVDKVTLYAKVTDANALAAYVDTNKNNNNAITFAIKCYNPDHTSGASKNIVYHFYNDVYRAKLNSLVNDELDEIRLAKNYKTSGTVYAKKVLNAAADENGLVETAFSATGINPETNTEATVIDCATAWSAYINAFSAAAKVGCQLWNNNASYNFEELYKALYTASKDVNYLKKTAEELAAEGGDNIDTAVVQLSNNLKAANDGLNGKGASDYKAYRWEKFVAARKEANKYVNAYNAQNYNEPDATYFPYNTDLDDAKVDALANKTQYASYIKALKVAYTAEEMATRTKALETAKKKYQGYSALDVDQADNLIVRTADRLLTKDEGAELYYLNTEIASAENIYGTAATSATYSARSWANYKKAYDAAVAARTCGANSAQFDAKYDLQCAVNNLRTVAEEADYTELETLMTQAQSVLENAALYQNGAADFGGVLAALGMDEVDGVQLFPASAKLVNERTYAADDQKKVDKAADALRKALAKMLFKNASIKNAETVKVDNDDTSIIKLNANSLSADVEAFVQLLDAAADGCGVSVDAKFLGTGAIVTYFKNINGVKIPVATTTVVVNADVNGDGVLDVLDAAKVELTANGQAKLAGAFKVAANLDTADDAITVDDYQVVVGLVAA